MNSWARGIPQTLRKCFPIRKWTQVGNCTNAYLGYLNMPRLHPLLKYPAGLSVDKYRTYYFIHSGQIRRGVYNTRRTVADVRKRQDLGVPRIDIVDVIKKNMSATILVDANIGEEP